MRRLLPCALSVAAISVAACDAPLEPSFQIRAGPNLSQFGIDEVRANPDGEGVYSLFDGKGNDMGRVDLELGDEQNTLSIELEGNHSRISWVEETVGLDCEDGMDPPSGACLDAAIVASLVAEAEGVDVPGYEPAPDLLEPMGFRAACETISTWAANCAACETKAYNASQYSSHDSGSCTVGWFDVTCWHKFCSSDDFELEIGGEW